MEVTDENFESLFPTVQKAIENADYIAIDTELTGIQPSGSWYSLEDSLQERYQRLRSSAHNFLVIQFGLVAFRWDPESKGYLASPFTFYIFPRSTSIFKQSTFLTDPASIHFLIQNGFDFNKTFSKGISYISEEDERRLRTRSLQKQDFSTSASMPLDASALAFWNESAGKIDDWLQNSTEKSMSLPPINSFQRRVLFQEIPKKYNNFLTVRSVNVDGNAFKKGMEISRLNEEEKKEESKKELNIKEADILKAAGFSRVIRLVANAKKPVIGHHAVLDFAHIVAKFIQPLPESLEDFRKVLNGLFPTIIDTKYFGSLHPTLSAMIASSVLEDIGKLMDSDAICGPRIEIQKGFEAFDPENKRYHDAGFDAYLTGFCYLKMAGHVGKAAADKKSNEPEELRKQAGEQTDEKTEEKSEEEEMEEGEQKEESEALLETCVPVPAVSDPLIKPYVNKFYMIRSSYYQCLEVDPSVPIVEPMLNNSLKVFDFPREYKTHTLRELFAPYGNVTVSWCDDTSAFIFFRDGEAAASNALRAYHEAVAENPEKLAYKLETRTKQRAAPAEAAADINGSHEGNNNESAANTMSVEMTSDESDPVPVPVTVRPLSEDAETPENTPKRRKLNVFIQ